MDTLEEKKIHNKLLKEGIIKITHKNNLYEEEVLSVYIEINHNGEKYTSLIDIYEKYEELTSEIYTDCIKRIKEDVIKDVNEIKQLIMNEREYTWNEIQNIANFIDKQIRSINAINISQDEYLKTKYKYKDQIVKMLKKQIDPFEIIREMKKRVIKDAVAY